MKTPYPLNFTDWAYIFIGAAFGAVCLTVSAGMVLVAGWLLL